MTSTVPLMYNFVGGYRVTAEYSQIKVRRKKTKNRGEKII